MRRGILWLPGWYLWIIKGINQTMGLNISFVIHIPYGKMIQKCKNSNFPPVPAGIVPEQKGCFHVWRQSASLPPYSLWYKSNRQLIHYLFQRNTGLHKYVIVICYYFQVFSSSHFLSVNMSLSLSVTVPPPFLSCCVSTPQTTIFSLWDFGVGRITCDDIIMTFTFCSFWW